MRFIDNFPKNFVRDLVHNVLNYPEEDRFVAVDTEFIREYLTSPLLCLLQLATPNETYVIDCTSVDVTEFSPLFENIELRKVFHSARQDLEMLAASNIHVNNFYDTQLYEMVLGTQNTPSYQSIVYKYLGKELKKDYALSDWTKRPLSKKQLHYSANDVLYLRDVYKQQITKLAELGRLHWLDDELQQLAEPHNANVYLSEDKRHSPAMHQLASWRADKAKQLNVFPEDIVTNHTLRNICRKGAQYVRMKQNARNTQNEVLREFWIFAEKIANELEIEHRYPKNTAALDMLKTTLNACSQTAQVVPHIIASADELDALIEDKRNLKCLSDWRRLVFGELALKVLEGKVQLRLCNDKVEFI